MPTSDDPCPMADNAGLQPKACSSSGTQGLRPRFGPCRPTQRMHAWPRKSAGKYELDAAKAPTAARRDQLRCGKRRIAAAVPSTYTNTKDPVAKSTSSCAPIRNSAVAANATDRTETTARLRRGISPTLLPCASQAGSAPSRARAAPSFAAPAWYAFITEFLPTLCELLCRTQSGATHPGRRCRATPFGPAAHRAMASEPKIRSTLTRGARVTSLVKNRISDDVW